MWETCKAIGSIGLAWSTICSDSLTFNVHNIEMLGIGPGNETTVLYTVQTFSISSTGHNLCEFLLETGVALLLLLWFIGDSLPVKPGAQGDDTLDGSLPTPQQSSFMHSNSTWIVG